MQPGLVVKIRPAGPWRIGPDSGARNRVDFIYHSDSLYSAVTSAMLRMGSLDPWLSATARSETPQVCFGSCFPFLDEIGFVVPPRTIWPPAAGAPISGRVRWKSARFVPLGIVQALLSGQMLDENHWIVDGPSECLVPAGRHGPFRTSTRWSASVDRLTGASERHSTTCIEFRPGAGFWTVISFQDDAARGRWLDPVKAAFRLLADTGFGGERSRGWGHAEVPEFIEGALPDLILPVVQARPPQPEPEPAPPVREPEPEPVPQTEPEPSPVPETEPTPNPDVPPTPEPDTTQASGEADITASIRAPSPVEPLAVRPAGGGSQASGESNSETDVPSAGSDQTAEPEAAGTESPAPDQTDGPQPVVTTSDVPQQAAETPPAETAASGPPESQPAESPAPGPAAETQPAETAASGAPESQPTEPPAPAPAAETQPAETAAPGPPESQPAESPAPAAETQLAETAVPGPPESQPAESPAPGTPAETQPADTAAPGPPESQPTESPAPGPAAETPPAETAAPGPPESQPAESPAPAAETPPAETAAPGLPESQPTESPAPGPAAETQPAAITRPTAPAHPHWLLSLFTPASSDEVDWTRGNYAVLSRGGRVESPAGSGELKKQLHMIAEGSVVFAPSAPRGSAPDVAPDGFPHPVFRAGFALSVPLPEVG